MTFALQYSQATAQYVPSVECTAYVYWSCLLKQGCLILEHQPIWQGVMMVKGQDEQRNLTCRRQCPADTVAECACPTE